MDHDQRFKTVLRTFFADFLRLFFAEWAARMDLSQIEWLDKELLPSPAEGPRYLLDMIACVKAMHPVAGTHADSPWLVLVHIEIESPDQTARLKPRLPHYYHHLRAAHGLPVLPIVVYLNVQLDGIGSDSHSEWFWELEVNTFRYLYVGLPGLDGVKYVQGDNWLGVALAALMRIPSERVAWLGAEALRRLSGAPVSDQQRFLLAECVQAYLPMDDQQRQEYEALLQTPSYVEARKMNKTVFEEGIEKGRRQESLENCMALLEKHFGPVSAKLRERLESLPLEVLRQLNLQIAEAESLEDVGLGEFAE